MRLYPLFFFISPCDEIIFNCVIQVIFNQESLNTYLSNDKLSIINYILTYNQIRQIKQNQIKLGNFYESIFVYLFSFTFNLEEITWEVNAIYRAFFILLIASYIIYDTKYTTLYSIHYIAYIFQVRQKSDYQFLSLSDS